MWAVFHQWMEAGQCRGSGNEVSAGVTGSRWRDEGGRDGDLSHAPGPCAAGLVHPLRPSRDQELGHVLPLNFLCGTTRLKSF